MAFYLFPKTMYRRLIAADKEYQIFDKCFSIIPIELQNSYELYSFSTKQYLGLGFILQFIPTTKAYAIRQQFSNDLAPAMQQLYDNLSTRRSFIRKVKKTNVEEISTVPENIHKNYFYTFRKYAYLLSLKSYFNISPLLKLLDHVVQGFNFVGIDVNEKEPLAQIMSKLPIIKNITITNSDDIVTLRYLPSQRLLTAENIIHSLLNPARILNDLLNALHRLINRIIEIGAKENSYSSLPRFIAKGMVSVVFSLVKIPVLILKYLIDIPLLLIKLLVVDPIIQLSKSIAIAYRNKDKTIAIITEQQLVTDAFNQSELECIGISKERVEELEKSSSNLSTTRLIAVCKPRHYNSLFSNANVQTTDSLSPKGISLTA